MMTARSALGLLLLLLVATLGNVAFATAPKIKINKTDSPPTIDGVLDDAVWRTATVVTDLRQEVPTQGALPSEKTEIYFAYDADTIYVGIRCYDREPEAIIARELREDNSLFFDDFVYVAFDPFLDRRNAFVFMINSIGTKRDVRFENNADFRPEWDGIWYADARQDDQGWTAEMAIPAKTLSFDPDTDTWGMEILRLIRRRNEILYWANYSPERSFKDVGAFGYVSGIEGLQQGKGLDVKPVIATQFRRREHGDDNDFKLNAGGEVIYKFSPSLTGSLTLNPDFSDTVVDEIQTNLTRFSLFFPEQRDLFVRDADIFQFGGLKEINGMPFFSRRVGLTGDVDNPDPIDLQLGTKVTGRVGRYTVGLLNTQMGANEQVDSANLSVVRATTDVLDESRVGLILTYGDPLGDTDNGVAGMDFRYRNSKVFGAQSFVADAFIMRSSTSGVGGDEMSYGLRLDYPNDKWNAQANFAEIQKNFNPAMGFVNRSDIRVYDGALRYRRRPGKAHFLRTIDWGLEWSVTTDTDNNLKSSFVFVRLFTSENQAGDKFQLWFNHHHDTLNEPFNISRGVAIPVGDYDWQKVYGLIETVKSRALSGVLEWRVGEFYDGEQIDIKGSLEWRPIRYLLMSVEHRYINTNLPHGDFDIEIDRLRVNANFSPTVSWTNFIQHESENHLITLNSQFRWIITPGSELTLTLNHDVEREDRAYKSTELDFSTQLYWTKRY